MVLVRAMDLSDDVESRAAYDAVVASRALGRPWFEPASYEEVMADLRNEDPALGRRSFVTIDESGVTGWAGLFTPNSDNTSMCWGELHVHPDHRRRGHGTALLTAVISAARAANRGTYLLETTVPPGSAETDSERFLLRHGFVLNTTEVLRHLSLPVSAGVLDALEAQNARHWKRDYRIEVHENGVPEGLRPSLCAVMNRLMVDAPTGDVEFEQTTLNPERYAEKLALARQQGRTWLTAVAVEQMSGDVVAYSDLILSPAARGTVWQDGTLVHAEHRGRRLGLAVKLANLRRLEDEHPTRQRVVTGNDGTNDHMVAINEQLGFEVVEHAVAYVLTL